MKSNRFKTKNGLKFYLLNFLFGILGTIITLLYFRKMKKQIKLKMVLLGVFMSCLSLVYVYSGISYISSTELPNLPIQIIALVYIIFFLIPGIGFSLAAMNFMSLSNLGIYLLVFLFIIIWFIRKK